MSLLPQWTAHLKGAKEKAEFKSYVLNSGALLDRLEAIIDKEIETLRQRETTEDYSSPSWPFLQADRLGQLKSYSLIKRLLNRKDKE